MCKQFLPMGPVRTEELTAISEMIRIYCLKKHNSRDQLCPECIDLIDYVKLRLQRCPFGETKPTCRNCKIHCYRKDYREKIRKVMVFSGPRFLVKHPNMAFIHLWRDLSVKPLTKEELSQMRKKNTRPVDS